MFRERTATTKPNCFAVRSPEKRLAIGIRAKYSTNIKPINSHFLHFDACESNNIDTSPQPAIQKDFCTFMLNDHRQKSPHRQPRNDD